MLDVIGGTVSQLESSGIAVLSLCLIARDYVEGMWRMLQQPEPEDFVLATGETHPVREFVEKAFAEVGMQIQCVLLRSFFRTIP